MLMENGRLRLCPRCNSPNITSDGGIRDYKGIGLLECTDCGLKVLICSTVRKKIK